MTSPPLIIDILIFTIALGVPACLWIARPRDKPSDFERRTLINEIARVQAAIATARVTHAERKSLYARLDALRAEQLRREVRQSKSLAIGWRGARR